MDNFLLPLLELPTISSKFFEKTKINIVCLYDQKNVQVIEEIYLKFNVIVKIKNSFFGVRIKPQNKSLTNNEYKAKQR